MNRSKLYVGVLVFLLILSAAALALPEKFGISAFEANIGARAKGMGGAFSSVYSNGGISFSNPACNTSLQGLFLSIDDTKNISAFQFLSMFDGLTGFGLVTKDIQPVTVEGNSVSYSANYAMITYAREIYGLSVGADMKLLVNQTYKVGAATKSGSGWDADLGITKKIYPWATIGAVAQNFLPSGTLGGGKDVFNDNTTDSFPLILRVGASAKIFGEDSLMADAGSGDLLIASDIEFRRDDVPSLLHAGIEWNPKEDYFLRFGMDQHMSAAGAAETSFTFGAGIKSDSWYLDAFISGRSDQNKNGVSVFYFSPEAQAKKPYQKLYLKVFSPKDNFVTDEAKVVVSGESSATSVKINSVEAFKRSDGKFSVEMPLYLGKNLIQISATTSNGEIKENRRVLKTAKIILQGTQKTEVVKNKKIEALATLGVINVPDNNVFKTEEKITRAELSVWLVKARNFPVSAVKSAPFPDVPANYWAAPYIEVATRKGLIKAGPDGLFRPEEGIKESEGVQILKGFDKAK